MFANFFTFSLVIGFVQQVLAAVRFSDEVVDTAPKLYMEELRWLVSVRSSSFKHNSVLICL